MIGVHQGGTSSWRPPRADQITNHKLIFAGERPKQFTERCNLESILWALSSLSYDLRLTDGAVDNSEGEGSLLPSYGLRSCRRPVAHPFRCMLSPIRLPRSPPCVPCWKSNTR